MRITRLTKMMAVITLPLLLQSFSNNKTLGLGRYPGAAKENFAPTLVKDNAYRNLALNRMAWHSSAKDYNLTSQLVTDGIVTTTEPVSIDVSTNQGPLPKREHEWSIDGGPYSRNTIMGADAYLQYTWHGMSVKANKVKLFCSVAYDEKTTTQGYALNIVSRGKVIGSLTGKDLPGTASRYKVHSDPNKQTANDWLPTRNIEVEIPLSASTPFSDLRLEMKMPGAVHWTVTELKFFSDGQPVTDILPSAAFSSAWVSDGGGQQWVYVDLGTEAHFDKVSLYWVEKARKGEIQSSNDAQSWTTVAALPAGDKLTDEVKCKGTGRYVRILMTEPGATGRYVLSELKVYGKGGLVARAHEAAGWVGNKLMLDGGNWSLQRASLVNASGQQISQPGFDDAAWITATVPGTVLTSYLNIGALPDPNHDDNLFYISESFFNSNFWYRNVFDWNPTAPTQHVFLNFDGINWKADVYLNGKKVNRIEGAFIRSKVDVTSLIKPGKNVLAVEIVKNAHPGAVKEKNRWNTDVNGGILGYDNPTFHATIGWDWISTIRGRDIGIWNDVFLSSEGSVSLADPVVTTTLNQPDTLATMTPAVILTNNNATDVKGTLHGWIGNLKFEKQVFIPAGKTIEESFSPNYFSQLHEQAMRLWWPNGYGDPYLYEAGFNFTVDGQTVGEVTYKAGIRQMTYTDVSTHLQMFVNGRRFVPLGGNWGFPENNLNYRGREYDISVGYHRDMHFNMIRDWVGQTGDEEFYEACDRYGIMVWQDFWLANPSDGPDPMDEKMFLDNARDYVNRIRQHASIGLYCGRNEGDPPATINNQLDNYVKTLNPGIVYIPNSADYGVSGHGPYRALTDKEYFQQQSGKIHSERGMPNVMTFEGLSRTLNPESLWPQSDKWGQHDYTLQGAQGGESFNGIIAKAFGEPADARQFTSLAQWENYAGYRAMYESQNVQRQGLLIWMSHSCWPSMTWQTYDYYFEPTAAYYGCQKACEPLHIQWDALTRKVEVVNRSAELQENITARTEVLDMLGRQLSHAEQALTIPEDSTVSLNQVQQPKDYIGVYYIRLRLTDDTQHLLSDNFYVCSTEEGNLQALNTLPKVAPAVNVTSAADGRISLKVSAPASTPALMVRLNLKDASGEQILPVIYSDNYFHLMPGESRTVTVQWKTEDQPSAQMPHVEVTCFNQQ